MIEKCPFCGGDVGRIVLRWKAEPFYLCENKECAAKDVELTVGVFEAIHAMKAENERLRKAVYNAYFEAWFDRQRSEGGTRAREAAWNDSKAREDVETDK